MSFKRYLEIRSMHKPLILITDETFFLIHATSYSQDLVIIQTNEDLDSGFFSFLFFMLLAVLPISSMFTFCVDKAF